MRERGAAREKRGRGWIYGSERATLKTLPATPPTLRLTHHSSPVPIQFNPFLFSPFLYPCPVSSPRTRSPASSKISPTTSSTCGHSRRRWWGPFLVLVSRPGSSSWGSSASAAAAAARRRWRRPRRRRRRRARPIKGEEKRRSFVAPPFGWLGCPAGKEQIYKASETSAGHCGQMFDQVLYV